MRLMRLTLIRRYASLLVLSCLAAACGGSSASSETTAQKLPIAPPPVLPLPTDPWAVIPDGASSVLAVDVVALRSSPHAGFLHEWAKAAGCLKPEQEALVFDKTERAIGAAWPEQPDNTTPALVVLKGSFAESDSQLVLDAFGALTRASAAPVTEAMHKRIRILTRGDAAAARIGAGLLVLGTPQRVADAAELAEAGKGALLANGELLTRTGARDELAGHAVVLVGAASEAMQRRAAKSLGAVGMPRDLLSGTLLGLLKIDDSGVEVEARVQKASAEAAASTAESIQRKLGQLSLLARLAGLPRVLETTQARAEGSLLHVTLTASHADVSALIDRMHDSLTDVPACAP